MTREEIRVWATNYVTEKRNKQPGDPWWDEDEADSIAFIDGAEWMQDKLTAENAALKQQVRELNERVINLQSADMTHQYNQAEAERVWPQIEQQIRDDEREKTLAQFGITQSPENPEKCKH